MDPREIEENRLDGGEGGGGGGGEGGENVFRGLSTAKRAAVNAALTTDD